jgi:3-phenylpropionate/cinnamic acid dioxygenase small subunit
MTDTEVDSLAAILPAVWNLLADYARLVDNREPVAWTRLFGESGKLVLPDREISGEAALTEFAANSSRGVHVQGVPTVQRRADGTIALTSNFTFVNAVTYAITAGEYRDELREENGEVVFARRQILIRVRTSDEPPSE